MSMLDGLSGYSDGSAGAPPGTPQLAGALAGYAVRPPWEVAGIDYAVGPDSTPSKDPATISMAGVSVDNASRVVTISGNNVTLDGYNFALHGGYTVEVQGSNATITDSNFVMGSNPSYYLIQDYGNNLTLKYDTLDGTATTTNQSALVAVYGSNPVIQYDWFKNFGQHVIEMNQAAGVTTTLDYRFNLIENGGQEPGAHLNFLQWGHGIAVDPLVAFNTTLQTPQAAAGEGFQFDGWPDATITGAVFSNNTMIARGGGAGSAMSFLMHPFGGNSTSGLSSGTASDNYFDISAAYGAFYPVGSHPGLWSFSSNYNLSTGASLTVSGGTEAHAPATRALSRPHRPAPPRS
ncbi:MAG: hypothetical protein ACREF3_13495 [Acetobacteraceae bacterium]